MRKFSLKRFMTLQKQFPLTKVFFLDFLDCSDPKRVENVQKPAEPNAIGNRVFREQNRPNVYPYSRRVQRYIWVAYMESLLLCSTLPKGEHQISLAINGWSYFTLTSVNVKSQHKINVFFIYIYSLSSSRESSQESRRVIAVLRIQIHDFCRGIDSRRYFR